jgi:putative MFS transporter
MINTEELGSHEKNFSDLFLINLAAFPAIAVATFIVDIPYFGRKNSLILSFLLSGLCFFVSYYMFPVGFIWFMIIARFFTRICVSLCW